MQESPRLTFAADVPGTEGAVVYDGDRVVGVVEGGIYDGVTLILSDEAEYENVRYEIVEMERGTYIVVEEMEVGDEYWA